MNKNELLQKIIHCENVKNHFSNKDEKHPCSEIIKQNSKKKESFQLPEPWSGDIENAPILFISSNPSISKKELYPTWDNPNNINIQDFFDNRFGDDEKNSWVYKQKVLNKNMKRDKKQVRYWCGIKGRAEELLDYDPKPGEDYCITEIVHCKSKKQKGVKSAISTCKELYLNNILEISKAKVIVGIGKLAKESLQSHFNSDAKLIEDGKRIIVFLPHPNAFSKKTFKDNYKVNLERIKEHLKK